MRIGVPKVIKDNENRIALTAAGVAELGHHGYHLLVERGAGPGSGFTGDECLTAGAALVAMHRVTNMPGTVPRTSTCALSNVALPYAQKLADQGFAAVVRSDPALVKGVNASAGRITDGAVAETFGLPYTPLEELLA